MAAVADEPFAPAHRLLEALRRRRVSSLELTDLYLARIERYNPALNAIITLDAGAARETARAADARRMQGENLPLLGLPITIKDSIDVRGLPTTAGLPKRAGAIAMHDAPVVSRLRAAGAVILGKTNVPPYTAMWQTDNRLFGRSNNPWDLGRTPGGSTGGGAAAVAAGLSALELGSDIGGSIRGPAAFCGIYGHRPSETAVPRSGQFPGSSLPNAASALNAVGPLARGADDLELALGAIGGAEPGEDVAWKLELPPPRHERLRDFRVAVLPLPDWLPVSRAVGAALDALIPLLRGLGAAVEETQPEGFDLRAHHRLYAALLNVQFSFNRAEPEEKRRARADQLEHGEDEFGPDSARGLLASAQDLLEWHRQREEYRAAYRRFFGHWDILLVPIAPTAAFPHDPDGAFLDVDGRRFPYDWLTILPGVATLSGQPATVFPAGRSGEDLPIGLQAIGPYLEDWTPIRFAALLGEEIGGFDAPRGYRP
jgi:amidase